MQHFPWHRGGIVPQLFQKIFFGKFFYQSNVFKKVRKFNVLKLFTPYLPFKYIFVCHAKNKCASLCVNWRCRCRSCFCNFDIIIMTNCCNNLFVWQKNQLAWTVWCGHHAQWCFNVVNKCYIHSDIWRKTK